MLSFWPRMPQVCACVHGLFLASAHSFMNLAVHMIFTAQRLKDTRWKLHICAKLLSFFSLTLVFV